jgi:hypothetical protein
MSDTLDRIVMEAYANTAVYHANSDSTATEAREGMGKRPEKAVRAGKKRRGRFPDVGDTGFPLPAFISGADVYGNQPAISMEKTTGNEALSATG